MHSAMRIGRRMAAAAVVAGLIGIWPALGSGLLWLSLALILFALAAPARRATLLEAASVLLWGALLALGHFFATDQFELRYVWLYSSPDLPLHLKLANVWGGDEGTTLLLATFCASLAAGCASRGVASAVTGAIAAAALATASWLAPFAPTPADWLAQSVAQGMNAHLMKIWMLFHAPLVMAAYAWTLALAGPALLALREPGYRWPALAHAHARRAWLVLTAGIGFGMIWAFEDAMYGQIWHWDPVQTAVFCVWCLLGAHLHGLPGWRVGGSGWRWMPFAALAATAMTALAMAVTRNPLLASSHRYVGADSWIAHLCLGIALSLACAWALWSSRHHRSAAASAPDTTGPRLGARLGLRLAQLGFIAAAAAAAGQLLYAFVAGAEGLPRPDHFKPFLGMLSNMIHGRELERLRAAFEQWDVDGYALAASLLLPLLGLGLVGGWYFFRRLSSRAAWTSVAIASLAVLASVQWRGAMSRGYAGSGILSQRIVELLPMLDAALVAGGYFAFGCLLWSLFVIRRGGRRALGNTLPATLIHLGMMLMLWGGLLSTALNSHSEHQIRLDGDASAWLADRHGHEFRIADVRIDAAADGGLRAAASIRALTRIEVRSADGRLLDGQTLYRDDRTAPERYSGPLRQTCELLDYRYARHVATGAWLLQPMIDHRWSRSVQFWVSPAAIVNASEGLAADPVATVMVKVFPFSSLLWTGLIVAVLGGAWLALRPAGGRGDSPTRPSARPAGYRRFTLQAGPPPRQTH